MHNSRGSGLGARGSGLGGSGLDSVALAELGIQETTMDVGKAVGAVSRAVGTREVNGREARLVEARRRYAGTIDDVWDALTNPERIPRWFMPVSGELRPGGRYQLQGNAGGTITTCDPPRLLALTWEMRGETSWVTVELTAAGSSTDLRLEHVAHVDDAFWDQYGPGAVGVGWDLSIMGLAEHLTGRPAVEPATAEAWGQSDEGQAYVEAASRSWADASMAAGTPATAARAAAARTTAFYTGAPPPSEG
jgi:uncharacterized protein YndB with AHSA1/START domain